MGAALYGSTRLWGSLPKLHSLKDVYWGPSFSDRDARRALSEKGLSYRFSPCPEKEVAALVAQKKVVGWLQGRLEFGPRALGNRSILFSAEDKALANRVNRILGRPDIMPFSPITLDKWAGISYVGTTWKQDSARFMALTHRCTNQVKEQTPCAVHANGTARAQVLSRQDNPLLYGLLEAHFEASGKHCMINTSFNRHGDPIVCSPGDAVKTFLQTGLDAMMIHGLLVLRS